MASCLYIWSCYAAFVKLIFPLSLSIISKVQDGSSPKLFSIKVFINRRGRNQGYILTNAVPSKAPSKPTRVSSRPNMEAKIQQALSILQDITLCNQHQVVGQQHQLACHSLNLIAAVSCWKKDALNHRDQILCTKSKRLSIYNALIVCVRYYRIQYLPIFWTVFK